MILWSDDLIVRQSHRQTISSSDHLIVRPSHNRVKLVLSTFRPEAGRPDHQFFQDGQKSGANVLSLTMVAWYNISKVRVTKTIRHRTEPRKEEEIPGCNRQARRREAVSLW